MNDAAGSVFVEDPSGNTWFMDGQGNISVNAPNDITMNAGGNISMTAGKNINSTATLNISQGAGASITETAGLDHSISAGAMMTQFAAGDFSLLAKNIKKIAQENINSSGNAITKQAVKDITVSSEANINKHAKEEVAINSGDKTRNH